MTIRSLLHALAALSLAVTAATSAQARIHSLTGNARYQIGNGIPLPLATTPAPDGPVQAVTGATIRQHPDAGGPSRVVLDPAQLSAPASPGVAPVAQIVANVYQVHTSLAVQFPASKVSFRAGGRTGAATVTFCPGNTVTPVGNPACNPAGVVPGLLRYTRTSSQFGGAARASFQGTLGAVLAAAAIPPPCTGCFAVFANMTPPTRPAVGASFGATAMAQPLIPTMGQFFVTATPQGLIVGISPPGGIGAGTADTVTSHGGPWTTGMLTVTNPAAVPAQVFVFSGSDGRGPGGTGSLSLVSGAISQSSIVGPNASRGWLNLSIGPAVSSIPASPAPAVAAGLALMALAGAFALRRRRARG